MLALSFVAITLAAISSVASTPLESSNISASCANFAFEGFDTAGLFTLAAFPSGVLNVTGAPLGFRTGSAIDGAEALILCVSAVLKLSGCNGTY